MRRPVGRILTSVLIGLGLLSASVVFNTAMQTGEAAESMFSKNYATLSANSAPVFDGQLHVVTWNVRYGEAVEAAIETLTDNEALQGADIILLQEMDEVGTDAIAQALSYNYVYFSAAIQPRTGKNVGNAILSRWPVTDGTRVSLPHKIPIVGRERIAVRAVVTVDEQEVHVYSIHNETISLSWSKRLAQLEHLTSDTTSLQPEYVVVGGDFNIPTNNGVALMTEHMADYGLERVSAGAGPTFKRAFQFWELDHVFASGMSLVANGVVSDTIASDHFPLWVQLTLK